MSLTGNERFQLLYGGTSIALSAIPTANQELRLMSLVGRPAVRLADLGTATAKIPTLSLNGEYYTAAEIKSYGRTGNGAASGVASAAATAIPRKAGVGAAAGVGAVHGVSI